MYYVYKKIKNSRERAQAQRGVQEQVENAPVGKTHHGQATADSLAKSEPDVAQVDAKDENDKKDKIPPTPDEERADKTRRLIYRLKLCFGLFGPFALQALDTTIVASALAVIATEFDQIKQLNWIISSFNLTSAAFLFFWAQMADIFGRHFTIQASVITMMVGSAICTGAPTSSFGVLLLGRSIQGIGCAGVNISVRTILADRVSLSEFAFNWTIFVFLSGVSFGIGPVVGGYLTETSWRWVFGINLPIAFASVVVVFFLLRKELVGSQPLPGVADSATLSTHARLFGRLSVIDFGGQLLFLWGVGLLLLALTWAGSSYAWTSAAVLGPLIIGILFSITWVFYERSMSTGKTMARVFPRQHAMMPWELLSQRDNCLVFCINFGGGMAMFAVMYFSNLYFTLVQRKSPSDAGLALLYYMPGVAARRIEAGVYTAVFSSNIWPRQTLPPLVFGATTTAVGITVLAWAINTSNANVVYGMMALIGQGVMIRMNPGSLHCLAYFPSMTARIACLSSFAIPFGGLVGLTIMSTVFNNKSGVQHQDAKTGIYYAFVSIVPFMWICALLSLCLGNVWLLKGGEHSVLRGSYLWRLVTRQKMEKERLRRADDIWADQRQTTTV
ncbi:hypothetical protein QQS21_000088 [Conoideocrella luteorostrata]|uniref:Major facilitator superfamily (MFS) profile domain-containing protein n=1 Tax=Conoideocrella luteorostrata TaxID=1105319 RepID=A0AAJ0FYU9_9HYPO|nr:hypothetical protein QQS21_000088 [Conoideocrella luteorostrata]